MRQLEYYEREYNTLCRERRALIEQRGNIEHLIEVKNKNIKLIEDIITEKKSKVLTVSEHAIQRF